MLATIADDFTGAAEIGGLALRYGLSVEIATTVPAASSADMLIITTDSRSMKKEDAVKKTADVLDQLLAMKPSFIYKKIDSVLRGHVLDELKIQLEKTDLHRALIVPANPSLGRTIVDGHYYLNGGLIHKSSFSRDPEFPIISSLVKMMVKDEQDEVKVLKPTEPLSLKGFTIGEVSNDDDVKAWALKAGGDILLAGGGDFFMAMLEAKGYKQAEIHVQREAALDSPVLLVSGTTFGKSVMAIKAINDAGGPVFYMPLEPMEDAQFLVYADAIVGLLLTNQKTILAFNSTSVINGFISSLRLRITMAKMVKTVLEKVEVKELIIEGGSTAAAIIDALQCSHFYPTHELQRGTIRMLMKGVENCHITIKPGSYNWPPHIERLYL